MDIKFSTVSGRLFSTPRAGFTLIELLVVFVISAILAALTLSTLGYVNRKGAGSRARAEVAALSAAIDSCKLDSGAYLPAQTNLCHGLTGTATGAGAVNTNKVYLEPTPNVVTEPFFDSRGSEYQYHTGAQGTNNVGFFDLWLTAGNAAAASAPNWIRN